MAGQPIKLNSQYSQCSKYSQYGQYRESSYYSQCSQYSKYSQFRQCSKYSPKYNRANIYVLYWWHDSLDCLLIIEWVTVSSNGFTALSRTNGRKWCLQLPGYPNGIINTKVMAFLPNRWIWPIGGVASEKGLIAACGRSPSRVVVVGLYSLLLLKTNVVYLVLFQSYTYW